MKNIKRISRKNTDTGQDLAAIFEFVQVPGGSFVMGALSGSTYENPVHKIRLSSFFISKYLVTQSQWQMVMGRNPSGNKSGESYPVESVSWNDIQTFLSKLNECTGNAYRLPTSAEWEYAARSGGSSEKWAGTSDQRQLNDYAWFDSNSGGSTQPVGLKKPNGLGIFDMSGNVWEFCSDRYDGGAYLRHSDFFNPSGPTTGTKCILRGGCYNLDPWYLRVSHSGAISPDYICETIGFRLVLPCNQSLDA